MKESKRGPFYETPCTLYFGGLRSFKVVDFDVNRKGVWDFLLVINSNLSPIWHRF